MISYKQAVNSYKQILAEVELKEEIETSNICSQEEAHLCAAKDAIEDILRVIENRLDLIDQTKEA